MMLSATVQKYAKAVVATVVFAIGLAVEVFGLDASTGTEIVTAVTGVAAVFGVALTTNRDPAATTTTVHY